MRRGGKSLSRAAKLARTTPATVRRYAREALARVPGGRYKAVYDDAIEREMWFLTPEGKVAVTVRSSQVASRIAEYWAAVNAYLRTGDPTALLPFEGETLRVGRERYRFLTDLRELRALANAGEVQFHDLYALST